MSVVDAVKLVDLPLHKPYYVKSIKPTKYGYICNTIKTDIQFMDDADNANVLSRQQLADVRNNVAFFSNRQLSEYIANNFIETFIVRLVEVKSFTAANCNEYKVPFIDVHPVRVAQPVFVDGEEYSVLESEVVLASEEESSSSESNVEEV